MRSHVVGGWGESEGCIRGLLLSVIELQLKGIKEYALRESSRWLWFPTLGFSMKNCAIESVSRQLAGDFVIDSQTWRRG